MKIFGALKRAALLLSSLFCITQLNGCATGTAGLECGMESMSPTIMASLDSFESAAISIKLSNRILLETPISEQDKWPSELFGSPSGAALFKMGLSLFASSQGVTIPTELDRETGFPKPTSALYIFLKEREKMLNKEVVRDDVRFFASQPSNVIARQIPFHRRMPSVELIDDNIYRNPLMAYGVVTANREEMVRLQQEIDMIAQGFKVCDAWVHKSREGDIKPAACKDPALKQDALEVRLKKANYTTPAALPATDTPGPSSAAPTNNYSTVSYQSSAPAEQPEAVSNPADVAEQPVKKPARKILSKAERNKLKKSKYRRKKSSDEEVAQQPPPPVEQPAVRLQPASQTTERVIIVNEQDRLTGEKSAELETMRKNYGKLADRVYNASVAGADFTMAALTKITCAIINGIRAVPNAKNEIRSWRGAYNAAVLIPRIKGIIKAFGYYKDNLGLQFVAYRTMYQQVKGTYPALQDEETLRTKEAMLRIETASAAMKQLEPKLELLAAGREVDFEEHEIVQLNYLASLFPDSRQLEQDLKVAWEMP